MTDTNRRLQEAGREVSPRVCMSVHGTQRAALHCVLWADACSSAGGGGFVWRRDRSLTQRLDGGGLSAHCFLSHCAPLRPSGDGSDGGGDPLSGPAEEHGHHGGEAPSLHTR